MQVQAHERGRAKAGSARHARASGANRLADIRASRQTPQDTTLKLAPSCRPGCGCASSGSARRRDFPRLRIGHQEVGLEQIGHAEAQAPAPAQRAAINALSRDLQHQLSHEQRRDQRRRLASDIQGGRLGRWGWGTTAVQGRSRLAGGRFAGHDKTAWRQLPQAMTTLASQVLCLSAPVRAHRAPRSDVDRGAAAQASSACSSCSEKTVRSSWCFSASVAASAPAMVV
jgi:hypothetical protein